jgi:glycosyltransferase involved in cell wall biosynthesis
MKGFQVLRFQNQPLFSFCPVAGKIRYLQYSVKESQKMKIAISARMLKSEPDDGISRFTSEVINRIIPWRPDYRFALVFDRDYGRKMAFPENTEVHIMPPAARHPLLWYTWHEWQLPGLLKRIKADLFLSPDGIISLRSHVTALPVIHDINFLHRPGDLPPLTSRYYNHFFRRFAARTERILTVSEFCRKDISSGLGVDVSQIDVAYNGVSDYFSPAGEEQNEKFRARLTGSNPYFLFVGNFSPRKNIAGVVKAFEYFRNTYGTNYKLVLAGGRLFLNNETDRVINSSGWKDDIILTGSVRHEELRMYYSAARALVFTPWFEGFGIPAAEAMRCGTPVILSETTSLPEVGGDAALYVNPANPEETAGALHRIISDETLSTRLIQTGLRQSQKFTWDKTAAAVMISIEKILSH